MLGPFNHTPPPGDDRSVAHAVAWVTLVLALLMTFFSLGLPSPGADLPPEPVYQEAASWQG